MRACWLLDPAHLGVLSSSSSTTPSSSRRRSNRRVSMSLSRWRSVPPRTQSARLLHFARSSDCLSFCLWFGGGGDGGGRSETESRAALDTAPACFVSHGLAVRFNTGSGSPPCALMLMLCLLLFALRCGGLDTIASCEYSSLHCSPSCDDPPCTSPCRIGLPTVFRTGKADVCRGNNPQPDFPNKGCAPSC